jgi:HAD superfamily hydrolase (TIGR01509 family)
MPVRGSIPVIIFDCNGVLVDSEPIATAVLAEELQHAGIAATPQLIARYFTGRRPGDVFAEIEAATGQPLPARFASSVALSTMRRLKAELRATPHATHALSWLRGPKCVASSSPPERVRLSLEITGLSRYFGDNVFSASDVAAGKPAPDLFLHAAGSVGVAAGDCIVVEDSPAGVGAAVSAGMKVIGFVGGTHAECDLGPLLTRAGAHAIVTDMRALKSAVITLRGY